MKRLLLKWVILTAAVVASAYACQAMGLPFSAKTGSFGDVLSLFIGSAALAFVNATLGKILKFMTIPLNCMTLGLVSVLINAAMLQLVGTLGFGFSLGSFFAALVGSILIAILNGILGGIFLPDDKEKGKNKDDD